MPQLLEDEDQLLMHFNMNKEEFHFLMEIISSKFAKQARENILREKKLNT